MTGTNPTQTINVSFNAYVSGREKEHSAHMEGGIPDYAFDMDYTLRQKIKAIPGVYPFFKALTGTWVPQRKQFFNMNGLLVGPKQYPDIYNMTLECANTLGIGIPKVYIVPVNENNAFTIATDDEAPIIVLYSSLVERFSKDELKTIIGHECGHIHNNHGIFSIAAEIIINKGTSMNIPFLSQALSLLSYPIQYMFKAWSRAAEVTSDRAGMICSNDVMDSLKTEVKLMHGAMFGAEEASIETALKQYEAFKNTPSRLLELRYDHPVTVRRMLADLEFINSDVLYKWRPEWKKPDMLLLNKQETDLRCAKYVGVMKNEEKRK